MVQINERDLKKRLSTLHRSEEEELMKALSDQYGLEYVNLLGYTINPDALTLLKEEVARDGELVPFDKTHKTISVAVRKPNNPKTQHVIEELEQRTGLTAIPFLSSTQSLEHGWERYHDIIDTNVSKRGVLDISSEAILSLIEKLDSTESVHEALLNVRTANTARRISETIETIFAGALALGASDIHIEPEEDGIRLRYRLDGVLQDIIDLETKIYKRTISRLKLLSGMVINQRQEAQDGRFTFHVNDREIEIRSSLIPGASGESIVMRLLDPTVAAFTLDKLGLNQQMWDLLSEQLKRPNGLVITSGPTGSGKTTMLYALLREAHNSERKVITIENPVEYKIEGIVQTQVSDDYTFANGLRAILRQDPDIIMVGEIRDEAVARTAIHAAQTGHLVFSTLHTNNAIAGFPRLIDLGVDARMIGTSINLMLAQRLVRVLCTDCMKGRSATEHELDIIRSVLSTHPDQPAVPNDLEIYEPGGCEKCNRTGYKGRAAVFEAIVVDDAVEEKIINDPREHIIAEAAQNQKIPTMAEDGVMKVVNKITSLAELQRVVDLTVGRHLNAHIVPTAPGVQDLDKDDVAEHTV